MTLQVGGEYLTSAVVQTSTIISIATLDGDDLALSRVTGETYHSRLREAQGGLIGCYLI